MNLEKTICISNFSNSYPHRHPPPSRSVVGMVVKLFFSDRAIYLKKNITFSSLPLCKCKSPYGLLHTFGGPPSPLSELCQCSDWSREEKGFPYWNFAHFWRGGGGYVGWRQRKRLNLKKICLISKLTANLTPSLNGQPIWLFLWIYSQFGSFSEFTANSTLSPNVILSVYYQKKNLKLKF